MSCTTNAPYVIVNSSDDCARDERRVVESDNDQHLIRPSILVLHILTTFSVLFFHTSSPVALYCLADIAGREVVGSRVDVFAG